jgi:lysyl-tRNA synthetase class II
MPPSGGCALGIDRLLMALTDSSTLDGILPFRD